MPCLRSSYQSRRLGVQLWPRTLRLYETLTGADSPRSVAGFSSCQEGGRLRVVTLST